MTLQESVTDAESMVLRGAPDAVHRGCAEPVIKYAGGKRWAIPIIGQGIADHLAGLDRRFIDPFIGGGAIPLWLGHPHMLLGDMDPDVAELFQVLQARPGTLAYSLSVLGIRGVEEADYYRVRKMRPKSPTMRAARFVYLNRLGFNGLNRKNASGDCNVPYAKDVYRKSILERSARDASSALFPNKEKFVKAGRALKGASIVHADFGELAVQAMAQDVLYLDMPYHATGRIYTGRGFDEHDQARAARVARAAADRGALVIAHNNATPLIRRLWEGFRFFKVPEKRQINSNTKGRARVPCVIITNAPQLLDMAALRKERAK